MFDIGFSELMVIGIVALIVIGPERLPKVARTAGHLFGRLQRYVSTVKSDISREMELDELKKTGQQFQESLQATEHTITEEVSGAARAMQAMAATESAPPPEAIKYTSDIPETRHPDQPQAELPLEPTPSGTPRQPESIETGKPQA